MFYWVSSHSGGHAPGLKQSVADILQMAHHVLLAHGRAVKAIRSHAKGDVKVGYAPTASMNYPVTDSKEDIEAARRSVMDMPKDLEGIWPCICGF